MSLGLHGPCSCDGCYLGRLQRLRELYALSTRTLCHDDFNAFLNGQFLVHSTLLLRQQRGFYELLYELLHAPADHWIHKDLAVSGEFAGVSELDNNNPLLGHVLERLWSVILGCAASKQYHCSFDEVSPFPW